MSRTAYNWAVLVFTWFKVGLCSAASCKHSRQIFVSFSHFKLDVKTIAFLGKETKRPKCGFAGFTLRINTRSRPLVLSSVRARMPNQECPKQHCTGKTLRVGNVIEITYQEASKAYLQPSSNSETHFLLTLLTFWTYWGLNVCAKYQANISLFFVYVILYLFIIKPVGVTVLEY